MTLMHQGGFGRGLTNADVVNDDAAAARVALRGEVNGQPFLVERTVRPWVQFSKSCQFLAGFEAAMDRKLHGAYAGTF